MNETLVIDSDEHAARDSFRASVRRFVEREIAAHVDAWDEAGSFPRELYGKAAAAGLLSLGYPEHLGGTPAPMAWRLIASEEIARAGSGGLMASLFSHSIGLPPIVAHGSDALQRRVVPPVLAGEKIAALARPRAGRRGARPGRGGGAGAAVAAGAAGAPGPAGARGALWKWGGWVH